MAHPLLTHNSYGKQLVRVVKVVRKGTVHEFKELTVRVLVEGNKLEDSYTKDDNRFVVPTDTIKTTIYLIAKRNPVNTIEEYGLALATHFLETYDHFSKVSVWVEEQPWERTTVDGREHPHSWHRASPETRTVRVVLVRGGSSSILSGIKGLQVMKTTGSGFENYWLDKYTSLKPAKDRIFKTTIKCKWTYGNPSGRIDYKRVRCGVRETIFSVFANTYSPSVQSTVYRMGEAVLAKVPEIDELHFALPNQHNWTFDLAKINESNADEVFYPSPDPEGIITASIKRPREKAAL